MSTAPKTPLECLNDTLTADRMFLNGMMTYGFWKHLQEYNKGILSDQIESELVKSIIDGYKELKSS